jgi:cytochrome P450
MLRYTERKFVVNVMPTSRDNPSKPVWSRDQLESPSPPEIEAPYFDTDLGAWVFSRYSDILAAFHASSLAPISPRPEKDGKSPNESSRLKMRVEAMEALSPAQLRAWHGQIAPEAHLLAGRLPVGEPVELMNKYARPLCLSLAAMVTGISRSAAEKIYEQAQQVSAAAAEPHDPDLRNHAKSANIRLRSCFPSGPELLRDSGFVALSQTMPGMLGNAWFVLMQYPQKWTLIHREPGLIEKAIEELLRRAGLVRILSRKATEDIDLNGVSIRQGQRVILRIVAGNRDPKRFSRPDEVNVTRHDAGHFALGAGRHACVGASLIRMAAAVITQPLIQRFASVALAGPVEWQGGSVFRSPKSLWTCLTTAKGES